MVEFIKEKIERVYRVIKDFIKDNLLKIIFLIFLFQFLMSIKNLPYVNLVNNFEYYSFGLILFLGLVLFRLIISNKKIILGILAFFILSAIAAIFEQVMIADFFGFVNFILLIMVVIRQLIHDRKEIVKALKESENL